MKSMEDPKEPPSKVPKLSEDPLPTIKSPEDLLTVKLESPKDHSAILESPENLPSKLESVEDPPSTVKLESAEDPLSKVYELGIENELCVVAGEEETISIELLGGFAEIFGSKLSQNTVYTFPPYSSFSIYSWKGCSIKISGKTVKACVTSDSDIMMYVDMHDCLEERRIMAESNLQKGPVCLIVGSTQSGKSTFCRFLLNYAAKMGRTPLHIDLDVKENISLIPGTVSISKVDQPSHITEGFSKQNSSVYCYGYHHPRRNVLLYYSLIKILGEIAQEYLCEEKAGMHASGAIIDTSSWYRQKEGIDIISFIIKVFKVDIVFVMRCRHLLRDIRKYLPSALKILFVPGHKGVIQYKPREKAKIRHNLIQQYFYGTIQNPLTPYVFDVKFSDIEIYSLTSSGRTSNADEIKANYYKILFQQELVNCVLGLSCADIVDANLITKSIKFFICINNIDMEQKVVTVMSPQPAPLPSRILVYIHYKNCLGRYKDLNYLLK